MCKPGIHFRIQVPVRWSLWSCFLGFGFWFCLLVLFCFPSKIGRKNGKAPDNTLGNTPIGIIKWQSIWLADADLSNMVGFLEEDCVSGQYKVLLVFYYTQSAVIDWGCLHWRSNRHKALELQVMDHVSTEGSGWHHGICWKTVFAQAAVGHRHPSTVAQQKIYLSYKAACQLQQSHVSSLPQDPSPFLLFYNLWLLSSITRWFCTSRRRGKNYTHTHARRNKQKLGGFFRSSSNDF